MARLKGLMENLTGSSGNVTFRHEKDGSVVMLQKISSRRSTRTKATMMAQLPMGNVNAMERLLHADVLDRFEEAYNKVKARGLYISHNLNRRKVYLTKQMKDMQSCVLVDHVISNGQLAPIEYQLDADICLVTDVVLSADVVEGITVAEFARDVLRSNVRFNSGDTLAFYYLKQQRDADTDHLWVDAKVSKVVLDPKNGNLLSAYVETGLWTRKDGRLAVAEPLDGAGAAFVYFRPVRDGRLLVSSQTLLCVNPMAEQYMTAEALDAAVKSRGGYTKPGSLEPKATAVSEFDVNPASTHFVLVRSNDATLGRVSTGRGAYMHGTEAVLTAEPGPGARFVKWTDDSGREVSSQCVYRLRVLDDGLYVAHFEIGDR